MYCLYFSERTMDLVMNLHNTMGAGVLWCGISGKQIGKLPPNTSINLDFTLLATKGGLQVGWHYIKKANFF